MDVEPTGLRKLGEQDLSPFNRIREKERARADLDGALAVTEGSIKEAKERMGENQMQIIAMRQARDKKSLRCCVRHPPACQTCRPRPLSAPSFPRRGSERQLTARCLD